MAPKVRLTPSFFDKIVSGSELAKKNSGESTSKLPQESFRKFFVSDVDRFTKEALHNTIRRDLTWLLNTLSFASARDLSKHPEVRTSVLNFGVKAFAGRSHSSRSELDNARAIRDAIKRFEPRLDKISVTPNRDAVIDQRGKIAYIIDANIVIGRDFIPIRLQTEIDVESSTVEVRE
ncbi:MAG: type VI secretion system baseplate subunit TssE [Hellea sp.]|nr:type VI secretion system baseplate subunit TssE [Hellea sp.]